MTWNPPPESERPDGYTCLGYSSPWNGYPSFWTACIWHKESQSWFSVEDWKMEPTTFAPLPEAAAARIAELEAKLAAEGRHAMDDLVNALLTREERNIITALRRGDAEVHPVSGA
jgi:hypothetical protein